MPNQDAIDALNSLQTPFAVLEARRKAGIRTDATAVREMRAYLARIGHSVRQYPSPCLGGRLHAQR